MKYEKSDLLLNILKLFLKQNVINGFYENNNYYYIYLKYNSSGEPVIKDLKIFNKRPFDNVFTSEELKTKKYIKKFLNFDFEKSSFYVFSTNIGLISYTEAISLNVGGQLLFVVKLT